jgi:hypothetical protein
MEAIDVIGWVGVAVLMLITFAAIAAQQTRLKDSNDTTVVYLDDLADLCELDSGGHYLVRFYRQSGNLYKDDQEFDDREKAIKAAVSTFKRAKIPYAVIDTNTSDEFIFRRPYRDHGGKAEGKKVAQAEIYKVS